MKSEILENLYSDNLKTILENSHAYDIASVFSDIKDEDKLLIADRLSVDNLIELIPYLDTEDSLLILRNIDNETRKSIINNLEPDDAADIILELEKEEQKDILSLLGTEEKELVESLLKYEEDETGAYMTSSLVSVSIEDEVKIATKKLIAEAPEVESIKTIFVVDDNDKYLGTVSLKKLLSTKSPEYIKNIFEETPSVSDKSDIEQTVNIIKDYGIYEMPVVSNEGLLLGMITMDDALDIFHEEQIEDYEKLAMLPDLEITENFAKTAFHRLPWLSILLILTIPIALVTQVFEPLLHTMVILMVFQPLILDSAGNVATQTLAVLLKLLSGENKDIKKNTVREIFSGIINGFFIGLIAALMALLLAQINPSLIPLNVSAFEMIFIIGISLWIVVILAPLIAIIIPLFLKIIRVDPAVASGPFITTIIDVLSLFIYLGLAFMMLGGRLV